MIKQNILEDISLRATSSLAHYLKRRISNNVLHNSVELNQLCMAYYYSGRNTGTGEHFGSEATILKVPQIALLSCKESGNVDIICTGQYLTYMEIFQKKNIA